MPDYIYLLENRLSPDQQSALRQIAQAARAASMNVFLAGGAVRDLISGSSVRDLDVAVQGNALKLKKPLSKCGATLWGEFEASRTLFYRFPASVRVEISSTRREEYPKPGKPVYHWASILEDLRRRDFTANAMALSLNEGSFGLLMDPLNGVADIEARVLRLVSNYGFLEEPARLLRATRFAARLGWELEERTKARFQSAKDEGVIESLSSFQRGYELEEIGHEEDGLDALTAMEREGWMRYLFPAWARSKADIAGLSELRRLLTQLQMHGINPDPSAASMQLLTAKLQSKELAALKKMFVRPGFVEEWNHLDSEAKEFAKHLTGKEAATPSATWKLLTTANPQAVLWLGLTSKAAPVQNKYKNFFEVWPEARQKIPFLLMQEMRITAELPKYKEMLDQLFFGTIDGKLETEEQLRAFLEPYSPPAPPPPVTVRRTRTSRKAGEAKGKVAQAEAGEPQKEAHGEEVLPAAATPSAATGAPSKKGKPPAKAAPVVNVAATKAQAAKQAPVVATEAAAKAHKGALAAKKSAAPKAASRKPAAGSAVKPAAKPPAKKPSAAKAQKKPAAKKAPPAKNTRLAKKR
jgi:tRNA nucleotidyltransferase (CCA-adding enzyme)